MDIFKPDLFSQSTPNWIKATPYLESELAPIISQIVPSSSLNELVIEYSGSIELNSSNYRISLYGEKYIIKKWPPDTRQLKVHNIEGIISFLKQRDVPVPMTIPFLNNQIILAWNNCLWTSSRYIAGDYFSGKNNQLKEASILTAKTANVLYRLPKEKWPNKIIKPQIVQIYEVVKKFEKLKDQWVCLFGNETSLFLKANWFKINQLCSNLNHSEIINGQVFPNHYDIHPHNLLFNENKLICLLDFDSIVNIPVGYSIAYSALKQCRQFISHSKDFSVANQVGSNYIEILRDNLKLEDLNWLNNFRALAQIETLRRISIILQLNLEGVSSWNKVIPLLMMHLYEAEELFD